MATTTITRRLISSAVTRASARFSLSLRRPIQIDGRFDDWRSVEPEYRDTIGDPVRRNHPGWGTAGPYVNATGRNDLVAAKVSFDADNVYFYVRTQDPITPSTDPNWMMLLIDADHNPATGWLGYDLIVNRTGVRPQVTTVERCSGNGYHWGSPVDVPYRVSGNELELAIPRSVLGITKLPATIDFKWADNIQQTGEASDFTLNGDVRAERSLQLSGPVGRTVGPVGGVRPQRGGDRVRIVVQRNEPRSSPGSLQMGEADWACSEVTMDRRKFLKRTGQCAIASVSVLGNTSWAQTPSPGERVPLPTIQLGKHSVTRLIAGWNPIGGYSYLGHAMDGEMRGYFTTEHTIGFLQQCEREGINAHQFSPAANTAQILRTLREQGSKMHFICLHSGRDLKGIIQSTQPIAMAHHGGATDTLFRQSKSREVRDFVKAAHDLGTLAGVSAHNPDCIKQIADEGWEVDFFMTCFYHLNRSPG